MTAITVYWEEPSHLPYAFRMKTSCRLLCAQESYKHVEGILPDSVTEMEIDGLHPGSTCTVNLFAFFNPASVDPGLVVTPTTEYDSKFYRERKFQCVPIVLRINVLHIICE